MITLKIALLFFAVVAIIAAAIVMLWQREVIECSPERQAQTVKSEEEYRLYNCIIERFIYPVIMAALVSYFFHKDQIM